MAMGTNANKTNQVYIKPVAFITGAAKRVGAQLARSLAIAGYDLVLHYHQSSNEITELKAELEETGALAILKRADLTAPGIMAEIWRDLPPVSLLVHNASIFKRDTILTMQEADLDAHFAIHVKVPLLLAQAFKAQLRDKTPGQMVLISDSSFGHSIAPQFFSYAASKLSLSAMTDLLAAAGAPNLRVNTLALGPTIPDMFYDEDSFARMAQKTPLKRTSTPEDVAQALLMLVQNASLTGQVISLANGMALQTYRYFSAENT